ncbi:autotransporter domain-containing protein [Phyllobacterium ifriqiyense]|uniref:autotransporter domain-containing protein n=1 Tax=Phyllobacterium ifriqiyense TaxID=314238 RepID=UPI003396300F
MINQTFQWTSAARRYRFLLATTALISCLVGVAATVSARAQSVTTSGDVNPLPAISPIWNVGGVLNVGDAGAGTLTVKGGGIVTSTYGQIGVQAGGDGTVTVSGSGSGWLSNSSIYVGYFGTGTLNIEDGGVVSNAQSGYIGNDPGSIGVVTVTGVGSSWVNDNYLSVGYMGNGALTVADGGRVTNNFGYIGANLGSIGTVSVSGGGSSWDNSADLFVGQLGEGTLAIESGGIVNNTTGHIGFSPSSTGKVTVTGDGSAWTNDHTLVVGNYGTGTLTVTQGGTVSSEDGGLGIQAGSTGTVTVRDAGSAWSMVSDLVIGNGGRGNLFVEAGGTIDNGFGYVGTGIGAEGHVNVTGAGSQWTSAHSLFVGDAGGSGTLLIEDGGTVTNGYGVIGSGTGTGTNGAVIVTGENSRWSNLGDLNLGNSGRGTLTIEDGGSVITDRVGYVGYGAGAFGAVAVRGEGSSWRSPGLSVGVFGTGELAIKEGGEVSSFGAIVGEFAGSNGSATISGTGSTWINTSTLTIGNNGAGTLSVEDGGHVSNTFGSIAKEANSKAATTVTGNGSTWSNSDTLYVGLRGTGSLAIEDGGHVSNATGFIGRADGAQGMVTVAGSGSAWDNATLYVGTDGKGSLSVTDGGAVSNEAAGFVGYSSGAEGDVLITGHGSGWNSKGNLNIGYAGTGTLTIADGATVTAASGVGSIDIGSISGSTGTINIGAAAGEHAVTAGRLESAALLFGSGAGSLVFNHTGLPDGSALDFAPEIAGQGTILHEDGSTVLNGDNSSFTGETKVAGGELTIARQLGGAASVRGGRLRVDGLISGDVTVSDGGAVSGIGTVAGNISLSSQGILSGEQGKTLAIGGDLDLDDSSTVSVALGGAPTPALFNIGGNVTLDGTLSVTDQGGFGAGTYRLFDYAGNLNDNGLIIGSTPAGIVDKDLLIQTAVKGQVNLISTAGAELGFWDGSSTTLHNNGAVDGGAGVWRADGLNWTDAHGSLNGPFKPNPTFAIFQGTPGEVTVDNSAGVIGVTGMQFASDGYSLSGDRIELLGMNGESTIRVGDGGPSDRGMAAGISATLDGASRLVKTGAGSLVLTGNNTYTGGTRIASGTLWLWSDANLGASSGGITFDGGTLATTAGFKSSRSITLNDSGRLDIFGDRELVLSGAISGQGGLEKAGTGLLKLSGINSYKGNTLVRAGTLAGNTDAIHGSIGNAGIVVFDQEHDAAFTGNIIGLNDTEGQMIKRGAGTLALAGVSTLDWSIERGGLVSATDRFGGDLDLAVASRFTFSQDYDGAYDGTISGTGKLDFTGGGSIELNGDSSGFAGMTEVADTTLIVKEALGGSALIGADGRLQGSGKIGSGAGSTVTLAAGSTLAPGNSIGALTVEGDLILEPGSRYDVEVAPGGSQSDLVKVTGSALLDGGAVAHIGMTGTYDPARTYTILSASGGVHGAFADVTSDFAFLDPTLGYSGQDVTLILARNDIAFVQAAETRNQRAAAQGLDGLGAGNDLYDKVVQLDEITARSAFDQLSGEIHASVLTDLIENSRHIRNAANERLRMVLDGVGVSATSRAVLAPGYPVTAFWASGFGSWGALDSDGNAGALDLSTRGSVGGLDGMINDTWGLGLMVGYSHSSFTADNRASSTSSENYHVGVYAGSTWTDVNFRSGVAYSRHDIDTSRTVGFAGFADSLSANYTAGTFQAFGELAYGFDAQITRLEPFVNLAHVRVDADDYQEKGGLAALASSGQATDTTFTTMGLRTESTMMVRDMHFSLTGMLGWRHAFGDTTPTVTHTLFDSDAFTVAGGQIPTDSVVIEAGLGVAVSQDTNIEISYQGQFGNDRRDHGFNANLAVKF